MDLRTHPRAMPPPSMEPRTTRSYEIEARNKYFEAIRAVADFELQPGPKVSFMSEVDLTQVERVRQAAAGIRPSYTAFVAKAVALALREFPYANRRVCRSPRSLWIGWRVQRFGHCDIAIASERDIPGAESVAFFDVFRDVDRQSLGELTESLRALSASDITNNEQWRSFSSLITRFPQWLSTQLIRLPYYLPGLWIRYRGAAVLISSPSRYGVDAVMATQSYPMSLAFGLVKPRPVVRDGHIVPCTTTALTLNFDRRIMAGAQGARFFKRIVELLEQAEITLGAPSAPATVRAA
jgi:pyruvate/2-oxoglutarate dehydrogenase complex dihydrolipoamide acyltransferase (E2) component